MVLRKLYGGANRTWVEYDNIPKNLIHACIAIEDKRFIDHQGVDWFTTMKACVKMFLGQGEAGGSTITQQLVKLTHLSGAKTLSRKAQEAFLALQLERRLSKDEILELYLNTTYFGAGSTGIKQASRTYFGKAPSALTLAEAAVIASLPYAPTGLNPLENPEGCKKRQLLVLAAMHKYGMINQGQLAEAKAEKIRLTNGTVM